MRKISLIVIALMFTAFGAATTFAAPSPNSGQCPGATDPANTKIDTNDGSIVLAAGTVFCVHASNNNTGILVADGETTLDEYIAAHIVNNGGQVPAISNYVIYPAIPSSPPSTEPSSPPSSEPSQPVITPTPSVPASETPVSSVPVDETPTITPPLTDTASDSLLATSDNVLALVGVIALVSLVLALAMLPKNRIHR